MTTVTQERTLSLVPPLATPEPPAPYSDLITSVARGLLDSGFTPEDGLDLFGSRELAGAMAVLEASRPS